MVRYGSLFFLFLGVTMAFGYENISYSDYKKTGGEHYVNLSDGWTNYTLTGDSTSTNVVVLLHGGTIPLCIWSAQIDALNNAGFRVLCYDQYGKGFSDRPHTVYSRELYVRQLKELLDSLQFVQPVTLVGPSFGGAIAVTFAAKYPSRVKSLVLISPALNLLNSPSPLAKSLKILRVPLLGKLLYWTGVRSKLIRRGRSLVPGGNGSPCDSAFVQQFRCEGTERALFSMFKSDAFGDYRELTRSAGKQISNILLLRGKEDKDVTDSMIKEVQSDLAHATFLEIEKSGHNPGSEAATVFNDLIINYLKAHE